MDNLSPEQREKLWRRTPSGKERAELRSQAELELEARLTDALAQMPDASVPSNFTARVMGAIDLEEARSERAVPSRFWRWNWHALLPRVAVSMAILVFIGVGIQRHEASVGRAEMVRTLSVVARATTVPSVDALEHLDEIQRMSQSSHADAELLAALQ
jgi:hypothetical protein